MPVPDELPPQLIPPSSRDLDQSVGFLKDILKHDTTNRARSPSSLDAPISRLKDRSFDRSSPSALQGRDATIYKHDDSEPRGYFKPSNRHVDRSAIRSRAEEDSPSADLSDMKRQLENTAQRLDRASEADAAKTKEDEELDQEMDDLKYRVKRVQDDLDYVARGPKTSSRDEERRRLERGLLSLMHERIPEVERKIKARDERKERERRQWARDRDRANDRFGRYDSKDEYSSRRDEDRDRPYSRGDDRDRPYSRGDDRDRPYSRGDNDRDRPYSRGAYDRDDRDRDRDVYRRERASPRDREYDRARSSPAVPPAERSAPPPPAAPAPPAPTAQATPPPTTKSMTPAERQAFARAEAQRRIQERMLKLGVTTPSSSSPSSASASAGLDSSVEDRLQQEKKEAEEKAKAAEKQAEERERARRERLASEKAAAQEEKRALTPTPTVTAKVPAPAPPAPTPTPKMAPPAPKPRAPAPPPPRRAAAAAPRAPVVVATPPAPAPPVVRAIPKEPEVDPQEEALRAREAALKKQKEEREARFQERLRQLEKEEEEARLEEERYQARLQAAKARSAVKTATPPPPAPAPVVSTPPAPAVVVQPAQPALADPVSAPVEKSTNPFSRLIKSGGSTPAPAPASVLPATTNGSTNPWARPQTAPPPSVVPPPTSKSPVPATVKTGYQTAPSEIEEDDWDVVREKEDSDDSSDDEITQSRSARANIAQQLFGGMLPRPASAAAAMSGGGLSSTPSSPAPTGTGPPPPAPPAPAAPRAAPFVVPAASGPPDTSALMSSIQGGLKLRPTKTVDKSAPPVSGRVIGDVAPPAHINAAPRPASPPAPVSRVAADPVGVPTAVPTMMADEGSSASARSMNRQSVGWFADRAADVGAVSPVDVQRLPSTAEEGEEEDGEDMYERATPVPAAPVPEILVDGPVQEPQSGLMADIDRGVGECCLVFCEAFFLLIASSELRVRSLYAFEGDGPEDLCELLYRFLFRK